MPVQWQQPWGVLWHQFEEHSISLVTLPLFHVTGMQGAMNGPIYAGGTMVIMARWDREVAAELIKRYQITRWRSISTMAIDMVNDPKLMSYDLSSLKAIGGEALRCRPCCAQAQRDDRIGLS